MRNKKFTKRIAKSLRECFGLESGMIFLNEKKSKGIKRSLFVCRNFNVGDRIKGYYKEKLFTGIIKEKEIKFGEPYLYVKTNEKVGKDNDLYKGYGLKGSVYSRDPWFFEWEELPEGDEIYRIIIERSLTRKELKKEKEYLDDMPF